MLGSPEVGVYITVEGNHVMQSAFTFRGQQTQQMNCGSDQEQPSFTSFSFCLAVLKEKKSSFAFRRTKGNNVVCIRCLHHLLRLHVEATLDLNRLYFPIVSFILPMCVGHRVSTVFSCSIHPQAWQLQSCIK